MNSFVLLAGIYQGKQRTFTLHFRWSLGMMVQMFSLTYWQEILVERERMLKMAVVTNVLIHN